MGVFDSIKGAVSGALGSMSASELPGLIDQHYPGGLNGMLSQLQKSGYGQQVASWLGHGPNDPIDVNDLRTALDNQQVRQIAEKLGLPVDQVLSHIADALPGAVDKQSPQGQLQPRTDSGDVASNSPQT